MHVTTEGIVLRQRKIANNRRLIVVFTEDYGKITAGTSINEKARGKSALALRPFTCAEYGIYKGRDFYNIDSAQVKKSYYSIGEDIDRFIVASELIEYIDAILPEGQAKPKIYEMTMDFMESVVRKKGDSRTLLYAFIIKSLKIQGIMPELRSCVNCGTSSDVPFFSIQAGGVMCAKCAAAAKKGSESLLYEPSFDIVNTLRYFADMPFSNFERVSVKPEVSDELRRFLSDYIRYHLDISVLDGDMVLR